MRRASGLIHPVQSEAFNQFETASLWAAVGTSTAATTVGPFIAATFHKADHAIEYVYL